MDLEKIIKQDLCLNSDFNYKTLYNDERGGVHKDNYKALLRHCISEGIITVKKYLVMENVKQDVFYDIVDKNSEGFYQLKEILKDYHQESYHRIAPFIYLLELIEPNYRINQNRKDGNEPILNFPNNIQVGHRFDGTNAFTRIYLDDSQIAINSTNDNIDNLMDTLEINDINVYILDVEGKSHMNQSIVLYKLDKNEKFNEYKDKAEHKFIEELLSHQI